MYLPTSETQVQSHNFPPGDHWANVCTNIGCWPTRVGLFNSKHRPAARVNIGHIKANRGMRTRTYLIVLHTFREREVQWRLFC